MRACGHTAATPRRQPLVHPQRGEAIAASCQCPDANIATLFVLHNDCKIKIRRHNRSAINAEHIMKFGPSSLSPPPSKTRAHSLR